MSHGWIIANNEGISIGSSVNVEHLLKTLTDFIDKHPDGYVKLKQDEYVPIEFDMFKLTPSFRKRIDTVLSSSFKVEQYKEKPVILDATDMGASFWKFYGYTVIGNFKINPVTSDIIEFLNFLRYILDAEDTLKIMMMIFQADPIMDSFGTNNILQELYEIDYIIPVSNKLKIRLCEKLISYYLNKNMDTCSNAQQCNALISTRSDCEYRHYNQQISLNNVYKLYEIIESFGFILYYNKNSKLKHIISKYRLLPNDQPVCMIKDEITYVESHLTDIHTFHLFTPTTNIRYDKNNMISIIINNDHDSGNTVFLIADRSGDINKGGYSIVVPA